MATNNPKKQFFSTATIGEINRLERIADDPRRSRPEISALIDCMGPDEHYLIGHEVHPGFVPRQFSDSVRFKKHANVVYLDDTVENVAAGMKELTDPEGQPAGTGIAWSLNCGYAFIGGEPDRRLTVVPLVELCKAAQIYAYHRQDGIADMIDPQSVYDNARNTPHQGATAVASVASRRKREERHTLAIRSIPVVKNQAAKRIWRNVKATGDTTLAAIYRHTRFSREGQKESNERYFVLAPEIAAYWAVCDYYMNAPGPNRKPRRNRVPFDNSPYLVPTHEMLAFYEKLENQVLVEQVDPQKKVVLRKPNDAEKEILLWGWVKRKGYDTAFTHHGKKLGDYHWRSATTAP